MINAYGWAEWWRLILLFLIALTRGALAIVSTTTCPDGRVSCPGYQDDYENKYCCPSPGWVQPGGYYCCNYKEKQTYNNDPRNIPEIIGGVVGAAFLLASAVVLSCFLCRCCFIYKYRHRKRNHSDDEPATRRSLSALGWRYRNWPRAGFVPSLSTCNGSSMSGGGSSSRYYYTSRPFREVPPASSSYHRHHSHGGRQLAYPPPPSSQRTRPESTHSRLHASSYRGGVVESCYLDNDGFNYAIRSPASYSSYFYEHINTILGEAKPFEAPPPYPDAHDYPASPPISFPEMQTVPGLPSSAVSPISTSASAATTSTIVQDDGLPPLITASTNCLQSTAETEHGSASMTTTMTSCSNPRTMAATSRAGVDADTLAPKLVQR